METLALSSILTTLIAIFVGHTNARIGDCSLPAKWRDTRWWYGRTTRGTIIQDNFRNYTSYSVIYSSAQNGVDSGNERTLDCTDIIEIPPTLNYLLSPPDKTTPVDCVQTYQYGPVMLESSKANVGSVFPDQCPSIVSQDNTPAQVLVKYPFNFEQTSCGLPDGTYQTSYAEDERYNWQCTGDISSETTVAGNKMVINSCYRGASNYYAPYKLTLTCLAAFSPVIVEGDTSKGQIIILGYQNPNTAVWSFYCGRYFKDSTSITISMSLNVGDDTQALCERAHDYSLARASPGYRAFKFSPNDCQKGACRNGANCTQRIGGFECQCLPGFGGTTCDTNVNECSSAPCRNGGTCIDANSAFSCACKPGFYGFLCEKIECNLPKEWQTRWWTEYIKSFSTMKTLTFEKSKLNYFYDTTIQKLTCEDDLQESNAFTYFSLFYTASNNLRACAQARIADNAMLFRENKQTQRETPFTSLQCKNNLGSAQYFDLFVKFPWTFVESARCPFPTGSYQTVYSTTFTNNQCAGNVNSQTEIRDFTMNVDTCFNGESAYVVPFKNNLACVASFPSLALDGTSTSFGDVTVLAFKDSSGLYSFYCTRYRIQNTKIFISMNAKDKYKSQCDVGKNYETIEDGYVSMVLTANECRKQPCQNGATCVDLLTSTSTGFRCTCPSGYTGNICDVNSNECASNPCQNAGTCQDGNNEYTCSCQVGYYGTHCELKSCDLPNSWISPGTWWSKYIDSYSRTNTVSFTRTDMIDKSVPDEYFCEAYTNNVDGDTYAGWSVKDPKDPNTVRRTCSVGRQTGDILLYKMSRPEPRSNAYTPSDCINKMNNNDPWGIYVNHPFNFDDPAPPCPWPRTTYQVVYREDERTPLQCDRNTASVATVPLPGKLQLDSCYSGTSTYGAPFKGELKCIQTFLESDIDGTTSGKGDVVILARKDPNSGNYSFYCTRYKVGDVAVELSLNAKSPFSAQCELGNDVKYDKVGDNYKYIKLTSFACSSQPCLNGGICSDLMADYICTCKRGFTGNTCQNNVNECASSPCINGGTCLDGVNSYTCRCQRFYSGKRCENFNDCARNPCQNGGTCADIGSSHRCRCRPGYTGSICETETDECLSTPCQNGGTCINRINAYSCSCPVGTNGLNCEININECDSQPCQNGGTCLDRIDGYYCRCSQFYIGVNCEHDNECGSNPCQNGATCNDDLGFFKCFCPIGYEGSLCETRSTNQVGPQCDENACQNGGLCRLTTVGAICACPVGYAGDKCQNAQACNTKGCHNGGRCVKNGEQYTCICEIGYKGLFCENLDAEVKATTTQRTTGNNNGSKNNGKGISTTTAILIGVASLLALLILITIIVILCRRRRTVLEEEDIYVDRSLVRSNLMIPCSNVYEPQNYQTKSIIVSHY